MELLQRQVDELRCCAAVFCFDEEDFETDDLALEDASVLCDEGGLNQHNCEPLSCLITVPVGENGQRASMRAILPCRQAARHMVGILRSHYRYPLEPPVLEVSSTCLSRKQATLLASSVAEEVCSSAFSRRSYTL